MKKIIILMLVSISFNLLGAVTPRRIVDKIVTLYAIAAQADYFGEPVSQLEHALQCAQQAVDTAADEETIIAALLHDIGHLCAPEGAEYMDHYGVAQHDSIGAQWVKDHGFSHKIAELIKGHVQAKRYLTYKDPKYYAQLSDASKYTLAKQGGPMTAQEAELFEQDPYFKEKLRLRIWDEQSKVIGIQVAPFKTYVPLMLKHLEENKK